MSRACCRPRLVLPRRATLSGRRPGTDGFAIEDSACGSDEFDYGIELFELGLN
jgi:hypothetical protein